MKTLSNGSLTGTIEKITYYNPDNGFTIARLRTRENQSPVTVKGTLPESCLGDRLEINGRWENHARYGTQFKIESFDILLPADIDGIKTYLESGFVKGISRKIIVRLIALFRENTLEVIEKHPERLREVKGVGVKTAHKITTAWKTHHAARTLVRFLKDNNLNPSCFPHILKAYGKDAVDVLVNDPFRIAQDLPRIGFAIAEAVIRNSDTPVDATERVQACILHTLERFCDQGHVFMPADALTKKCESDFGLDPEKTLEGVEALSQSGELVVDAINGTGEPKAIYPAALYEAEKGLARRINALLTLPVAFPDMSNEQIKKEVVDRLDLTLSPDQLAVLEGLLHHRAAIVTGGPGTGKTTLIQAITAVFKAAGKKIILTAPTGRAARRISEVTGKKAVTIHKLLGFNPLDGFFEKNRDDPLHTDALIVDEASMVDLQLMHHLINALPMTGSIILVGDVFQLPSVGPGNVLSDMIRSEIIKVFKLEAIFRQDEKSAIVLNAHRVRQGKKLELTASEENGWTSDFYFIEQESPDKVVDHIVELCRTRIPERFGYDPVKEIQVLTPVHKGDAGTLNLNRLLQKTLNTGRLSVEVMGNRFKVGDKVMHLKNNYAKDVFNGDIGVIVDIQKKKETLVVNYEGRDVSYDFMELDELTHAYAVSIHKSQGSEYPAVVIPLLTRHYVMLQRNLLYTAITRGKGLVVLVGSKKALAIALKNDKPAKRLSFLAGRLNPLMIAIHGVGVTDGL